MSGINSWQEFGDWPAVNNSYRLSDLSKDVFTRAYDEGSGSKLQLHLEIKQPLRHAISKAGVYYKASTAHSARDVNITSVSQYDKMTAELHFINCLAQDTLLLPSRNNFDELSKHVSTVIEEVSDEIHSDFGIPFQWSSDALTLGLV